MSLTTSTQHLPSSFSAGTTVRYERILSQHLPLDGWTYTIFFVGGTYAFNSIATASEKGDRFEVSISADSTAGVAPGSYRYVERVSKAGDVFEVGSGTVDVMPNMGTAGSFQSDDERMLVAIQAVISGKVTKDIQSYQLQGRALTRIPLPELVSLEKVFKQRVWAARNKGKLGPSVNVYFPNHTQTKVFF